MDTVELRTADLRGAIRSTMLETWYQPIIRIASRQPVALEALARLNHPIHGQILPDQFIPLMEDAGLAEELTERMCATAFADMTLPEVARHGLIITLNFPLDVLLLPRALERLDRQRAAAGYPADRVVIELTESKPVNDLPTLRRSLEHFRSLGYGVVIDDAGPEVPSYSALIELPFTSVKLDKVLVRRVIADSTMAARLQGMIDQAHARGMTVVAEGVEDRAIWDRMEELGADGAQGFLMSRALTIADVPGWLESWRLDSPPREVLAPG
jgi:EAL domain-containing protein (putative c-di-GMP-specific phosphodiesterase class I)